MQKSILLVSLLVGLFISLFYTGSKAQTTIDFNDLENNQSLGKSYTTAGFTFAVDLTNEREITTKAGLGHQGSITLYDNNVTIGSLTRWTITKNDGSEFQFQSIYLQQADPLSSASGTIQGFKNGSPVGSAKVITFNSSGGGLKDYVGDAGFFDVDEIRIWGADINFYLDHFTYGPVYDPVNTDPTQVTSISVLGNPGPSATSVTFTVNFNKTAEKVSMDDFELTTTGNVTGSIASIAGSGTAYTVTVNNVSGEGTLRLDLKAGTNITNTNGNTGTAAFTSGSPHILSFCHVETFENSAILRAATFFTSNGRTFALGGGFEIESRNGFGAVNPGGSRSSDKYIKNNNTAGTFTLSSAQDFTMSTINIFLSDKKPSNGNNPTGVGSLTIRGKKGGNTLFTIVKTSGFPDNTDVNGGYFTINFATSGTDNYRNINIDQLEFTIGDGFVELLLDNFNFCQAAPDVDVLAPRVLSSIPDGAAFSTATSVDFTVVFDENAFNVSADDFGITTTGTVSGTVSTVSGSGSVRTVTVSGITGEGSLKVNLSASNGIRDALNNSPSPEFTVGQVHLVGSCFIETFEDETNGATVFSGNGMSFSLLGKSTKKRPLQGSAAPK